MTTATPEVTTPVETFANLGLSDLLVETLSEVGYESPTPIQRQTIPLLLEGRDVVGLAQTGTGKTAAFSLPILDRLDPNKNVVQALVLCPTRELAIQVAEAIHLYGKKLGRVKVLPVYGGDSIGMQMKRLAGASRSSWARPDASWITCAAARCPWPASPWSSWTRPTRC
jgi:ATP-dependent RNA helicase DeaD